MLRTVAGIVGVVIIGVPSCGVALATVESRTGVPIIRPSVVDSAGSGTAVVEERATRLTLKQIEDLKQEISELRGLIEVQEHAILQLKKSQEEFYLDLDKRLGQLQTQNPKEKHKMNAATSTVDSKEKLPDPYALAKPVSPTIEDVKTSTLVTNKITEVLPPPAPVAVANENVRVSHPPEKEAFESAYKLVRTKRYSEAVIAFKNYLTKFPEGEHAPNAHYWLGEVYMSQWQANKAKKELLDKANQEFLNITSKFPTHQKITDALLKLGLIENEKGNLEAARQYLTEVKDRYPGSAAARIAETRLQQLR